jgi:hypothetical protein
VVDGCYGRLLEKELARHRRSGGKYGPVAETTDGLGMYRRSRVLLEALESGVPVVVARTMLGGPRSKPPVVLPWDRSVRSVRVSADDVVRPSDSEHPWYGMAADDPTNYAAPSANTNPNTLPFNLG